MTRHGRQWRLTLAALATLLACTGTGCTPAGSVEQAFHSAPPTTVPPTPLTVPVTLYFRNPHGDPHLVATTREIPRGADPARHALELLIEGPSPSEGLPVLSEDVTIERFEVADQVAHVTLDGRLDHAGNRRNGGPGLLTLAAVANTLTEFSTIRAVRLQTPSALSPTAFDGWGLPPLLVRDESFLKPDKEDPSVQLAAFSTAPQVAPPSAPSGGGDDDPAHVASVRLIDRLSHVRLVIELTDAAGDPPPVLPRAHATVVGNVLRLELSNVAMSGELPTLIPGPGGPIGDVTVHRDEPDLVLSVRYATLHARPFALLTDENPARIILDVMK